MIIRGEPYMGFSIPGISYGFRPDRYNQIIVFQTERDLKTIVAANPNMIALMGDDDHTRENFPGVYIAGVMTNL